MAPEVEKMRRWLHGWMQISEGDRVVDLGCGSGDDLRLVASPHPEARFVGVDRSGDWIERATALNDLGNVDFVCADVSRRLPFEDDSFDAVYSVNLLECLPDPNGFLDECARILRPGGRIVVGHFDWDTQTFDGPDRAQVRKIVHAFNDWQQAWMEAIDPWAGRRLRGLFAESGAFEGEVEAYTLTSSSFEPDSYGRRQAESFEALARRGLIEREEYESFMRFQEEAAATGRFFYSVTMFAFVGIKLHRTRLFA